MRSSAALTPTTPYMAVSVPAGTRPGRDNAIWYDGYHAQRAPLVGSSTNGGSASRSLSRSTANVIVAGAPVVYADTTRRSPSDSAKAPPSRFASTAAPGDAMSVWISTTSAAVTVKEPVGASEAAPTGFTVKRAVGPGVSNSTVYSFVPTIIVAPAKSSSPTAMFRSVVMTTRPPGADCVAAIDPRSESVPTLVISPCSGAVTFTT